MKKIFLATIIVLFLVPALFLFPATSYARGDHWGGGFAWGILGGLTTGLILNQAFAPYPRYYYSPPVYYYPAPYYQSAPVIIQSPPPTYVQPQPQYWYWCESSRAYYPYVRECPSGWRAVNPQTSSPPR